MSESIKKILEFTKGMDFAVFTKDAKTVDAVVRNIEILGEAAKNIPEEIKLSNPGIDWRAIAGTRNVIAHQYFGVDNSMIWEIIEKDLPKIKDIILKIK
jgi:hypothetical protein